MDESRVRSPWWYRHRVATIVAIYLVSIYTAYSLPYALHLRVEPFYAVLGHADEPAMLAIGFLSMLAGWLLRIWGTAYLRGIVWSHDARTEYFYVVGPFRYVRNPLYLGNLFITAGIAFFVPLLGWPVVVGAQWAFARALIAEEEEGLQLQYGDAFERYRAIVPRWLPRLHSAPSQAVPHLGLLRGIEAEPFVGSLVIAYAVLVLSGFDRARWYVAGIVFAGVVAQYVMRSRIHRLKTSRAFAARSTAASE